MTRAADITLNEPTCDELARGGDQRMWALSAHEIGHALTWLTAGLEIDTVYVENGWWNPRGSAGRWGCLLVTTTVRDRRGI